MSYWMAGDRHRWNGSSMECGYRSVKYFLSFSYKMEGSIQERVKRVSDFICQVSGLRRPLRQGGLELVAAVVNLVNCPRHIIHGLWRCEQHTMLDPHSLAAGLLRAWAAPRVAGEIEARVSRARL